MASEHPDNNNSRKKIRAEDGAETCGGQQATGVESRGRAAATVIADWLMAGLNGEVPYDDESRGEMAYVLGLMCAAGVTDHRHTHALLSALTPDAPPLVCAGVVRAWDMLGDVEVAAAMTLEHLDVVYRLMGTPAAAGGCREAARRVLARMLQWDNGKTVHVPVAVESWIEETMDEWDEVGGQRRISAVCAMTLLPPATLLQHLSEAAELVGMVEDGLHEENEDKAAPDRLAQQICECLVKLPEEYHEQVGRDLLEWLRHLGSDGDQHHATDHSRGAARIFRCMPAELFDKHAPNIVRTMVYGNKSAVVECANVLLGKPGYDSARIASMIKAHLEKTCSYSLSDLLRRRGLPHALGTALPRDVLVQLSGYLFHRMFDMDNTLAYGVCSEAVEMGEVLAARLEPHEILPYLPDIVKPSMRKIYMRTGGPPPVELPHWRAPILARLPYELLQPYLVLLVPFLTLKDDIYHRLLPLFRQFPPHEFGAVMDAYVALLGSKRELYTYDVCARSEVVNLPLFRVLDLIDDASLASSSLRAAAVLSRVMDVEPGWQHQAWAVTRRIPPDVTGPDLHALLGMLPPPPEPHPRPLDEELDSDVRRDVENNWRLHLHQRVEVISSPEGMHALGLALASENAAHRRITLQFLRLLPDFAAALLIDKVAPLLAARITDEDASVRHEAIGAIRMVDSAVAAPFAHQITHGLEENNDEIRRITMDILRSLPDDAVAPLVRTAIDKLLAPEQCWAVRHSYVSLLLMLASKCSADVQAQVPRLLACVADAASVPVGVVDAVLEVLKALPVGVVGEHRAEVVKLVLESAGSHEVNAAALRMIQQWDNVDVLAVLEKPLARLLAHSDDEVRRGALPVFTKLADLTDSTAADDATTALLHHPDMAMSSAIASVFTRTRDTDIITPAVGRLLASMSHVSDRRVRWAAGRVLQSLPASALEPHANAIAAHLMSEHRSVAMAVLHVVTTCTGDSPLSELVVPLIELVRRTDDPEVCQAAACALMRRPPESILPHAKAVAEAVVSAGDMAITELRQKGTPALHQALVPEFKVLLKSDSADMRRGALSAMDTRGNVALKEATSELEACLNDGAISVRELAVTLLKRTTQSV